MTDIVVTVPKGQWQDWIGEGDLPGEEWSGYHSHFWLSAVPSDIRFDDRLYIVAHGRLRGYAPVKNWERHCSLRRERACLVRSSGAVAVTIPESVKGFQGWRRRWWDRADEIPFPDWATEGVA